ncbi:hypothetical protein DKX38_006311 [Salix brachista]|uniref:Uncharacterized protein n=1 Tax=Salix brachista TaxID=2182728 RepID=A0A5N5N1R8_9ROSI|nr:hypothetical protein DKX38_006311 [Salix brachista]
MKHPNPIGTGLATEVLVEAARPDCIVPGQITPISLVGLKWRELLMCSLIVLEYKRFRDVDQWEVYKRWIWFL